MSDVFSLFDQAVDAQKFDTVDEGKGSRLRLSSVIRSTRRSRKSRSTSRI